MQPGFSITSDLQLATVSEARIEDAVTGQPLTLGYRPRMPGTYWWNDGDSQLPNYYQLMWDVEAMLLHPRVKICLDYYKSGMANMEFEVTDASSPAVAVWAESNWQTFFNNSLVQAQRTMDFGRGGYEVLWERFGGYLNFVGLEDFHPHDTRVLTRDNEYLGVRVYNVNKRDGSRNRVDLWGPDYGWPTKGFWFTHNRRYNRYFGMTQCYAAWKPWRRLAGRDGAEDVEDLACFRFGVAGPLIRYPPDDFRKKGGGETDYDNARQVALELSETYKSGTGVALPSTLHPGTDKYRWEATFPEHVMENSPLRDRCKYLEDQIALGIGTPPELFQAQEGGSGWSGRKVPLIGFVAGQQHNANNLLTAWKKQIADSGVKHNFGPEAWFTCRIKPMMTGLLSEQPKEDATPMDGGNPWQQIQGARGATAWKNTSTGEVRYQDQRPTSLATEEEEIITKRFGDHLEKWEREELSEILGAVPRMTRNRLWPWLKVHSNGKPGGLASSPFELASKIEDDDAAAVFGKYFAAFKKLSLRARAELIRALSDGSSEQRLRAATQVITKYREEIARYLTETQIASALAGMRRVVDKLSPANVSSIIPQEVVPPSSLSPAAASMLLADIRSTPAPLRPGKIEELPAEQAQYVYSALARERPFEEITEVEFPLLAEAVKALQSRRILSRADFDELTREARDHAFTIAGDLTEATIGKVRDHLAELVERGPTLKEFRQIIDERVAPGTFLSDSHSENVYRTAIISNYSQGMDRLIEHPIVSDLIQYEQHASIADSRRCKLCELISKSGIKDKNGNPTGIYRKDDPIYVRHCKSPQHWQDRCGRVPLSVASAAHLGIPSAIAWQETGTDPGKFKDFVSVETAAAIITLAHEMFPQWQGVSMATATEKRTAGIDFDGTLTKDPEHAADKDEWKRVKLRKGVKTSFKQIKDAGLYIMIHTANPDLKGVERFLRDNDVPFDEIVKKPEAFVYADDKAVPAGDDRDWESDILPEIMEKAFPEKAEQPFKSWQDVKEAQDEAQAELERLLERLNLLTVYVCDLNGFDEGIPSVVLGDPKGKDRSHEKVEQDYGGDWSRLLDPVRATVACDSMKELRTLARKFVKELTKIGGELARPPKDRFRNPLDNGYRDLLLNPRLPESGVIAEVQFHLKPMLLARERGKGLKEENRQLFQEAWDVANGDAEPKQAPIHLRPMGPEYGYEPYLAGGVL